MTNAVILVLGDQLSRTLSALRGADKELDIVLMCEVAAEATYVKHHKKKIALIFAAMRAFADDLRTRGWRVDYVALDQPENTGSFDTEVAPCRRALETKVAAHHQGWRMAGFANAASLGRNSALPRRFVGRRALYLFYRALQCLGR